MKLYITLVPLEQDCFLCKSRETLKQIGDSIICCSVCSFQYNLEKSRHVTTMNIRASKLQKGMFVLAGQVWREVMAVEKGRYTGFVTVRFKDNPFWQEIESVLPLQVMYFLEYNEIINNTKGA